VYEVTDDPRSYTVEERHEIFLFHPAKIVYLPPPGCE
jgi:hypothetical protein